MSLSHDTTRVTARPGAKAAVLMELRDAGFPVPAFEVSPDDPFAAMQRLGTPLAVRSCASVEDSSHASFAGQFHTVLNVRTYEALRQAMADCKSSATSQAVRAYSAQSGVDVADIRMDVIVQRMVAATVAGVAFSINPVTGADEVVIEACEGTGEALLAGETQPLAADHPLLRPWRAEIERLARAVHRHYGQPQDIEFAIDAEGLWLLQARPVTRISFATSIGEWTNADFRDGGVSASVCSPLMWSLYERAWRESLLGFLREIHLLSRDETFEPGRMFFGRPYWNLGAVKRCLAKLPGYVERRFDEDLSVTPAYEGDGVRTSLTLRNVLPAVRTVWSLRGFFARQEAYARTFIDDGFEAIAKQYDPLPTDAAAAFAKLTGEHFRLTECQYFRTIFAASLAKLDLKDAFPDADEATLVAGLPPLRHFEPTQAVREMARAGTHDVDALPRRYRHHHPSGLDVIHPRWDEQRAFVEQLLANADGSPDAPRSEAHETARQDYVRTLPRWRRAAFGRKLDRLRAFLYLREQMRDCSNRLYYLIRRCALTIGAERGIGDSVFFMTIEEILRDDRTQIAARRDVYERFRHFEAPNEIGGGHMMNRDDEAIHTGNVWRGLAASRGIATGTARLARSAGEAAHIPQGSILICPFTDPGWTPVLDRVAAVVTETGGLLSHAAVICREFGVPAVLGVQNVMRQIPDGATVQVDGHRGEVRVLDAIGDEMADEMGDAPCE